MMELKYAFNETNSYERKIKILSISPYSHRKTMNLFGATDYMVKKSREMKKKFGIIPEIPHVSKGKIITREVINFVHNFFQQDEISRMCPGKKDCLSIRNIDSGKKEAIQKRLILMNLKEAYCIYKHDTSSPVIGFSTFARLRPKSCVLAGASGTHTVCVCTYHQNAKLQVFALGLCDYNYQILMEKSVCDLSNRKCMLHLCNLCSRETGVREFLSSIESLQEMENINYKQWVTVDRCNMIEKCESSDEYINSLSKKIVNLTRHHYIAKTQSHFLKELKLNMTSDEVILLLDFAENFSFIIQDEIQGFHWENSQCTVHPFVMYYKNEQEILCKSFCFLSPDTKHSTTMVYTFLCTLIPHIKSLFPKLTKIHYFSDGCAGQYKNRFNFLNIYYHKNDFNVDCEWHFFATSHGKSPCDGIGGVVKRTVAKASLQRPFQDQIITPLKMFEFCEQNFHEVKFFYTGKNEIQNSETFLASRFQNALPIVGTQKIHKILPLHKGKVKVFETSNTEEGEEKKILKSYENESIKISEKPICGQYVICQYDNKKWIGIVESYDIEFDDFKINFLHPSGISKFYSYPLSLDTCNVEAKDIIKILDTPTLNTGTNRIQYQFSTKDLEGMS